MTQQDVIFLNSVFFVIGFTLVFSIVGILLQSLIAKVAIMWMNDLRVVGGVVIIIFGALIIASSKYIIPFFNREHKFKVRRFSNSYLFSFIFGVAFAIGWTPCVGPILGSIYVFALSSPGLGFLLLMAYALGLGIPFLIVGAFTSKLAGFMQRIRGFLKYFNIVSGIFLVALGVLVVTGYIGLLSVFLIGGQGSMISLNGQLNFLIAIAAGVLTFLSPCILPLVPAYFSYMAGTAAVVVKQK